MMSKPSCYLLTNRALAPLAYTRRVAAPAPLAGILAALHNAQGRQDAQTVRGGTMVSLSGTRYKALSRLLSAFVPWIDAYVGRAQPWRYAGLWSVRMGAGGYHVPHNHPKGDVSGVYYVEAQGEGGTLTVGAETVQPESGLLVLFPSTATHGTSAYEGGTPRLTVAFDVKLGAA